MEEILSQLEGDNSDNYVVIDVRGVDEIMMGTGTMSDKVRILPLPQITAMAAFDMDEKSFEAQFNFPKPSADDTLVMTCKMGVSRRRKSPQCPDTRSSSTIREELTIGSEASLSTANKSGVGTTTLIFESGVICVDRIN